MIKLGITGGIGAGKTHVSEQFEALGVPVYVADKQAKLLMTANPELKSAIIKLLGDEAYLGRELNREFIAEKVFENKTLLEELNALVHPFVNADYEAWLAQRNEAVVAKEAAILIETGTYKQVDKVIVVTCPEEVRIDRVVDRDDSSIKDVMKRVKSQMSDSERVKFADFVIENDGDQDVHAQVAEILEKISQG